MSDIQSTKPTCSFTDCNRPTWARGLCGSHYLQFWKGKELTPLDASRVVPLEDRFWRHVQKTDSCWLWTGKSCSQGGHGHFKRHDGTSTTIHRISWEIHNGPIPAGLWVLHNCPGGDNPRCVNPAHLWLGTPKDNSQDMLKKGGGRRLLTNDQIIEIRSRYAAGGVTQSALASDFSVSKRIIWCVVSSLYYADVR